MPNRIRYLFEVALSFFPGDTQTYVEDVYRRLRFRHLRVYRHTEEAHTFWGADKVSAVDKVFRLRSRRCVIFLSQRYEEDKWCQLERASILERNEPSSVIVGTFDEVRPAWLSGLLVLDLRAVQSSELAKLISESLKARGPKKRGRTEDRFSDYIADLLDPKGVWHEDSLPSVSEESTHKK